MKTFRCDSLSKKQMACLQFIADASMGCPYTSVSGLHKVIANKPNILLDENDKINVSLIDELIEELVLLDLVEKKTIKEKDCVGLTDRCDGIRVISL